MKKDAEPNVKLARVKLERAVLGSEPIETIGDYIVLYASAVIYRHMKNNCATIVHPDKAESICNTVYQDEKDEFIVDVFMLHNDLHDFCINPHLYIPEDRALSEVNIFGMFENLETDILLNAVLLSEYGIKKFYYYGWDFISNKYGKWNLIDKINVLAKELQNPINFDRYKNNLMKKRNGILTIQDLVCLKQIKCFHE